MEMDKVKIGSALKDADKVPRYERRDPWPGVPFVTPDLPTVRGAVVSIILAVVGFVVGLTWSMW